MPVSVPLVELVSIAGARDIWPEQFAALVATCEDAPHERATFGIVADWVDQEAGEPEYARAWRWLMKRPEVEVQHYRPGTWEQSWRFRGLPTPVAGRAERGDVKTLAGAVAHLSRSIAAARSELE